MQTPLGHHKKIIKFDSLVLETILSSLLVYIEMTSNSTTKELDENNSECEFM
jgi:hypothetical protein